MPPTFAVILAAAGKSTRFNEHGSSESEVKKVFVHLQGKPLWLHSAEMFNVRDDVIQVIIVVASDDVAWFRQNYANEIDKHLLTVVTGGEERVDSVRNALNVVTPQADYIAVHDAARPCITTEEIDAVFREAVCSGAALLASPIIGTIKRIENYKVKETVERQNLWEAQTPQVFRRGVIERAYKQKITETPTDDAQLVELSGESVSIVPGERLNIKVTTQADLAIAQWILQYNSSFNPPTILCPKHWQS